jgi:hypothetical protein
MAATSECELLLELLQANPPTTIGAIQTNAVLFIVCLVGAVRSREGLPS